jgi:sulfite exporter TauE/SafE
MHELTLLTACAAGLLGSTHCVAMCGGVASLLGATHARGATHAHGARTGLISLYHVGRVASYGAAGAVAGASGAAAGSALAIPAWSDVLRLVTAVVIVLIGLDIALGGAGRARWLRIPERIGARVWRRVAPRARAMLPATPSARALVLGLLWGWLPCGLVYSVLIAALASGSAIHGGATMVAFGLGTAPAMLALSHGGARIPLRDGAFSRVLGAVIVACGLWTAAVPIAALTGADPHAHHVAGVGEGSEKGQRRVGGSADVFRTPFSDRSPTLPFSDPSLTLL